MSYLAKQHALEQRLLLKFWEIGNHRQDCRDLPETLAMIKANESRTAASDLWQNTRVLRLMRQAQLLVPSRRPAAAKVEHNGHIVTARPNQIWGTDGTLTMTIKEGKVTVFAAIDHCSADCVGIHAVKRATRFEALEPIRQGVREHFGGFSAKVAAGLVLRHDHGTQYMSEDFQNEVRFLGMDSSPSFIRQPEGNGCIERFFRTLKEQLL
jgi:transposase InsO family protein